MSYVGIENKKAQVKIKNIMQKHTLHAFSCLLFCAVVVSVLFANLFSSEINLSIKRITSRWTPKQEDFGKIKFVNFDFSSQKNSEENASFIVKSPFKNYYANNVSKFELEIFGLGDPVVYSPIDGTVRYEKLNQSKYILTIESDKVKVEIGGVDYVCVNQNQQVETQTKIAVSSASKILFKIKVDGEYVELIASGANTTFFE